MAIAGAGLPAKGRAVILKSCRFVRLWASSYEAMARVSTFDAQHSALHWRQAVDRGHFSPISDVMMMQSDTQNRTTASPCGLAPTAQPWHKARAHLHRLAGPAGDRYAAVPRSQADAADPHEQGGTSVVTEKARPQTRQPPLYRVVLHNDDYTPMEFVVEVLLHYFSLTREQAIQIMLTVHTRGKGIAGTYTRQIAETKVALVNDHARAHQHPLLCTMERA